MNIARSCPQCKQRPAPAHFAGDLLVHLLHSPLHRHGDRSVYVQSPRTSRKVGIESGIRGQAHAYIARSSANLPRARLRALGGNVTAARLAAKCALNAPDGNVAGTGMKIDVAR